VIFHTVLHPSTLEKPHQLPGKSSRDDQGVAVLPVALNLRRNIPGAKSKSHGFLMGWVREGEHFCDAPHHSGEVHKRIKADGGVNSENQSFPPSFRTKIASTA